ncbi:MAG: UDP-N-acetylmuramate--L-alanine ligase [Thermomicrobiales bacterium]|nr:UDP-N-acetylmuramate--L-alanine ligase [Thermomicrobiales bacterium]
MTRPALPPPGSHVHFVGIGGIGMSGLARMLHEMGYRVSGSDSSDSPLLGELRAAGIEVFSGHDAANLAIRPDLLVRTSAVTSTNPEVAGAEATGIPVMRRAEFLGAMTDLKTTIAVAGTHGKSTTSSMLTSALRHLGLDPSYAVGAILHETGTNAELGAGELMVVEADEYDRSFLALHPAHIIITNAEYDHPDIFDSPADYEAVFVEFARQMRPGGTLVIRGDDEGAAAVLQNLITTKNPLPRSGEGRVRDNPRSGEGRVRDNLRTFGLREGLDWTVTPGNGSWQFRGPGGATETVSLQVPGLHNALNALAVVAMLDALGVSFADACRAVEAFTGIGRRFEIKGEQDGVLVIDDYAHHPTEVEATLKTALATYPDRRLWAVFQPHTYSRTAALLDEFAAAFALAPNRVLLDVYGAREVNDGSVTDEDMRRIAGEGGQRAKDVASATSLLAGQVDPGDVVLTMGAGDITNLGPRLLERLESWS